MEEISDDESIPELPPKKEVEERTPVEKELEGSKSVEEEQKDSR